MGWGLPSHLTGCVLVCFKDRFTAKGVRDWDMGYQEAAITSTKHCPKCREPLVNMGKNFRPPRKNNDREWRRIETGRMLGLGYWSRLTPRQMHLVAEKRKRLHAFLGDLKGGAAGWRAYRYDPERV